MLRTPGNDGLIDVRFMHGGRLSDSDGGVKHIGYSLGWNARRPFISQTVNRCVFNGSLDQAGGWCNPNDDSLQRTTSGMLLQPHGSLFTLAFAC